MFHIELIYKLNVDLVGIEPTTYPCHGYVLPLNYRPWLIVLIIHFNSIDKSAEK